MQFTWSWIVTFLATHFAFDVAALIIVVLIGTSLLLSVFKPSKGTLGHIKADLTILKEDKESQNTLWEYTLHEDNLFNDRQNFFLLFESIILAGAFTGLTSLLANQTLAPTLKPILSVAALLGLVVTVLWWFAQLRQKYIIDSLAEVHRTITPAYRDIIDPIRKRRFHVSSISMLAYVLPLVIAVFWTVILMFL